MKNLNVMYATKLRAGEDNAYCRVDVIETMTDQVGCFGARSSKACVKHYVTNLDARLSAFREQTANDS